VSVVAAMQSEYRTLVRPGTPGDGILRLRYKTTHEQ
jgi:hypothetical protein